MRNKIKIKQNITKQIGQKEKEQTNEQFEKVKTFHFIEWLRQKKNTTTTAKTTSFSLHSNGAKCRFCFCIENTYAETVVSFIR